jgi:hypothetical protein
MMTYPHLENTDKEAKEIPVIFHLPALRDKLFCWVP